MPDGCDMNDGTIASIASDIAKAGGGELITVNIPLGWRRASAAKRRDNRSRPGLVCDGRHLRSPGSLWRSASSLCTWNEMSAPDSLFYRGIP